MAEVGRSHHIRLGGNYYLLEKHHKEAQDSFVPRYSVSDIPTDRDFSVFNRWITKSCHLGEGQDNLDITDEDVSVYRYKKSSGVDISEKYKLQSLYNSVLSKSSTNDQYLPLATASLYVVMADGANVYLYAGYGTSWGSASASGIGTTNINKIATDGTNIWVSGATINNLIRKGTGLTITGGVSTISWSSFSTVCGAEDMLFNNSYLYTVDEDVFYQLSSTGTQVYKYPATGTAAADLNCIAEYNGNIYFGGFANTGNSKVWVFDGSDTSQVSINLPYGDELQCMFSCMGLLWLGVRRPITSNTFEGHLYSWDGSTLRHHWKVDAETDGNNYGINHLYNMKENLYFNWNHLTGLGRYDLKEGGVSRDVYTSLSASAANRIFGITSLWGKFYYSVNGRGVYAQEYSKYSSSNIESSANNLNTVQKKLWTSAEIRAETLGTSDTVEFQYSVDKGQQYISAGTMSQIATKYKADLIPTSASPAWTKSGSATTEEISPTGILHITGASSLYYYRTESSISNTTGSCLEAKVKLDTGSGIYLKIYDGTKYGQVWVSESNIVLNDSAGGVQGRLYVDTTTSYNIIRVTMKANVVKVYLNGVLGITGVATNTTSTKQMRFDPIASAVDIYIDHVFYSIADAYSPDDNDLTDTYCEIDLPNVVSESLAYKLILTNTSGTLTVLPVSVRSIPLMSNKKAWELTIKAVDYPEELSNKFSTNKAGADYMSSLFEAQGGRQILEFVDIDGSTYNVIIIKGPAQDTISLKNSEGLEAVMTLTLWEI